MLTISLPVAVLSKGGERLAGYSVVTLSCVIEAEALPKGTSAQKAELIALGRALQLAAGIRVNIGTDSKYAFTTLRVHGALYKEKGLLNSGGKDTKYGKEILELVDAIWAPPSVAVMHCRGHQRGDTTAALGSRKADREARRAASKGAIKSAALTAALFPNPLTEWDPNCSHRESTWFKTESGNYLPGGWWEFEDGRRAIAEALAHAAFVTQFHQETHMGRTALETMRSRYFDIPRLSSLARVVCEQCETCARSKPRQGPKAAPGVQGVGGAPFDNVTVDFTELPRGRGWKHPLVSVCTSSGSVEAYATRREKAHEVARLLLKEIIPRVGIPTTVGSENGPAFVADVVQLVAKGLKITWK